MLRHIGRNKNTGTRYIIVMMQMPGTENALVVQSDTIPAKLHDYFMNLINSKEAQATTNLFEYLNRVTSIDGRVMLTALHQDKLLESIPIDVINMLPNPQTSIPLRDILNNIKTINNPTLTPEAKRAAEAKAIEEKFNPHKNNLTQAEKSEAEAIAKNLLAEADLLAIDVNKKKEQAYRIAPHLKPKEIIVENNNPTADIITELKDTFENGENKE